MFKKILLILSIVGTQAFADKGEIIKNLTPFFGKINPVDIVQTPFDGVFEVIIHNPIGSVLISENGQYLIQGSVVDLTIRQEMASSDKVNQLKKTLINTVKEEDKIIFKAKNEKYIIHVFTDVDCPYCRQLHSGIDQMNALGITVKYLASPIASLHPVAQSTMEKIWCADDRVKAMDEYKTNQIMPHSKKCKNPVAEQLLMGERLGVNGTPAIFLADGTHLPGYLPPETLLQNIKASVEKQ